jgi:hypothetical protein
MPGIEPVLPSVVQGERPTREGGRNERFAAHSLEHRCPDGAIQLCLLTTSVWSFAGETRFGITVMRTFAGKSGKSRVLAARPDF